MSWSWVQVGPITTTWAFSPCLLSFSAASIAKWTASDWLLYGPCSSSSYLTIQTSLWAVSRSTKYRAIGISPSREGLVVAVTPRQMDTAATLAWQRNASKGIWFLRHSAKSDQLVSSVAEGG